MSTALSKTGVRTTVVAVAVDTVCILLFCAIGRRNHGEGVTVAGVLETAWPFLIGMAVGWLLSRGWRQPTALRPTGLTVWVATIAVGMGIRFAVGAGIALSFVVVATLVTAALLLGWRALARAVARPAG